MAPSYKKEKHSSQATGSSSVRGRESNRTSLLPYDRDFQGNAFSKVLTQEECVNTYFAHIMSLQPRLKAMYDSLDQTEDFLKLEIRRYLEQIKDIQDCRAPKTVLVGFIGATGAGKSKLVAAVLGLPDIVPSDSTKACTSVIIEIHHNESEAPESLFRAEIIYLQQGDWDLVLQRIYNKYALLQKMIAKRATAKKRAYRSNDLEDQDDSSDAEDDDEAELRESIKDEIRGEIKSTLSLVYPFIKTIKDMANWPMQKLSKHENVRELGKVQEIHSTNLDDFTARVATYVEASKNHKWPLIQKVKEYVKSDILRHGLVLVDIPGTADRNMARSAMAEAYQQKLSVTVVVTPMVRAQSNAGAYRLLTTSHQQNLALDGSLTNDLKLIYVATHSDEIHADEYSRRHPKVLQESWFGIKLADTLSNVEAIRRERVTKSRDSLQRLDEYCRMLEGQVLRSCIRHRNQEQAAALKASFEEICAELIEDGAGKDLKVFTVSSTKFFDIEKHGRACGFQNKEETQIPAFRKCLIEATLPYRQETARALLSQFETFVIQLEARINSNSTSFQISQTSKGRIEAGIKKEMKIFHARYTALSIKTADKFGQEMKAGLFRNFTKFQMQATKRAVGVTKGFVNLFDNSIDSENPTKLRYQTYRVVARNHGEHIFKCIKIDWNEDLAKLYKDQILGVQERSKDPDELPKPKSAGYWQHVFHILAPKLKDKHIKESQGLMKDFIDEIIKMANATRPGITESLNVLYRILPGQNELLCNQAQQVFDWIQDSANNAHRLVRPEVSKFMIPGYELSAKQVGKGCFMRMKEAISDHVLDCNAEMYEAISDTLQDSLGKVTARLPKELERTPERLSLDTQATIEHILRYLIRTQGHRNISELNPTEKIIEKFLSDLEQAWLEVPEIKEEKEDDEPEPQHIDLEELMRDDVPTLLTMVSRFTKKSMTNRYKQSWEV